MTAAAPNPAILPDLIVRAQIRNVLRIYEACFPFWRKTSGPIIPHSVGFPRLSKPPIGACAQNCTVPGTISAQTKTMVSCRWFFVPEACDATGLGNTGNWVAHDVLVGKTASAVSNIDYPSGHRLSLERDGLFGRQRDARRRVVVK